MVKKAVQINNILIGSSSRGWHGHSVRLLYRSEVLFKPIKPSCGFAVGRGSNGCTSLEHAFEGPDSGAASYVIRVFAVPRSPNAVKGGSPMRGQQRSPLLTGLNVPPVPGIREGLGFESMRPRAVCFDTF